MLLPGWTPLVRRLCAFAAVLILVLITTYHYYPISTHPIQRITSNTAHLVHANLNTSKLALLIENRPSPQLTPVLLHFISVVPASWPFQLMGSPESLESVKTSRAIQAHIQSGKLNLTLIPANTTTSSQEEISAFLTTEFLWGTLLAKNSIENVLIFQTDSILCANSRRNLDDWLEYDWVGAPWEPSSAWGGNGGLSLRRVSRVLAAIRANPPRGAGDIPEDVWLTERMAKMPGAKMANGTVSLKFSGELHSGSREKIGGEADAGIVKGGGLVKGIDDWREGGYEPMGYHMGGSGKYMHPGVWGNPEARRHIWQYCPEVKMILKMDAERYIPGGCGTAWKRDAEVEDEDVRLLDRLSAW